MPGKLMENLLSKTLYKFKKSYGGTPEPPPPEYPPCRRGPSLKILVLSDIYSDLSPSWVLFEEEEEGVTKKVRVFGV